MPFVVARPLAIPLTPPQAVPATAGTLRTPASGTPVATVVLAHGAGSRTGTRQASFGCASLRRALAARGCAVLTFAFGYRAAGRRRREAARLRSTALRFVGRDAIPAVRAAVPAGGQRPLVLGGRSLGGRTASLLAAEEGVAAALVLLAYPLRSHRAGAPPRTAHWPALRVPLLFVSGDRDRLCARPELDQARAAHLSAPSDLVVIDDGNPPGFIRLRFASSGRRAVLDELATPVADWVAARSAAGVACAAAP